MKERFSNHLALLVLIAALGFALRLVNLGDRSPHYDEITSIFFAALEPGNMVKGTAADTMPPLYYYLLHLWLPVGGDLFQARLLSTFFSVLSIPLLYLFGLRLVGPRACPDPDTSGRRAALVGAFILAISPFHVFYGQEVRMYSLLGLLGLVAAYFFLKGVQEGGTIPWVGFTLGGVASMYVHNLAFLLIGALDLYAIILLGFRRLRPQKPLLAPLALSHLAMVILYLPWLVYLPGQLGKVERAFWIPRPGIGEIIRSAIVFNFNLPAPPALLSALLFLSLLMVALTVYQGARFLLYDKGGPMAVVPGGPQLLFLAILFLVPMLFMFIISQLRPIYVERGVMVSSMAYYLLLGWAFFRLPLGLRVPLAGGYLFLVALLLLYHYQYREFPRSPFREAAALLSERVETGDVVIHDNKLSFFPMRYFAPGLPQGFIMDPPGSPNDTLAPGTMEAMGIFPTPPEKVDLRKRVWFVVFQKALGEAQDRGKAHENKSWFDSHFRETQEVRVGDLELYLYLPIP